LWRLANACACASCHAFLLVLQLEKEFAEQWQAGSVVGWEDRGEGQQADSSAAPGMLDLDAFDSADELEILGEAF
jgi:splicing factor 3A subunit 3